MKVFVSYSHAQQDWVRKRLVPVLEAGGTDALVDYRVFRAGRTVPGQMDATQDQADLNLLCLSKDYYASAPCQHEMNRAIAKDPGFNSGMVVPLRLDAEPLPPAITAPDPLYIDFRNDADPTRWELLQQECGCDLGIAAPLWLDARDAVVAELGRYKSVNLVTLATNARWRELLRHVAADHLPDLALVDLQHGATSTRDGLLAAMLHAFGSRSAMPSPPDDLRAFTQQILALGRKVRVGLTHFDLAPHRAGYDVDLFAALRWLVMEERRPLVLLVQSRAPLMRLLPANHPLSEIDAVTVELR